MTAGPLCPDCGASHAHGSCGGGGHALLDQDTSLSLYRELPAGTPVGEYRVTRRLGAGGMGIVYAGVHPLMGRKVAIKVLNEDMARTPDATARFLREARAAGQLQHRNIVDVFAFGQLPDGRSYQVMELLSGRTLRQLLALHRVLDFSPVREIFDGILRGLSCAHERGVIHRDLKPDNIFVAGSLKRPDSLEAKILDFGLAKRTRPEPAGDRLKTRTGLPIGTPCYMSPEQCKAVSELDARSDIYSLGVVLYEVLCGQLPFEAESHLEVMTMQLNQAPRLPSQVNAVPAELEAVILKAMAKAPEARFGSASEMRSAFLAACDAAIGRAPMRVILDDPTPEPTPLYEPVAGPEPVAHKDSLHPLTLSNAPHRPASTRTRRTLLGGLMLIAAAFTVPLLFDRRQEETNPPAPTPAPAPAPAIAQPTPTPTPAPPPAQPAAPTGSLLIEVVAGAELWLDGAPVGHGPRLQLERLTTGPHRLRIRSRGKAPAERMVFVSPQSVTRVKISAPRPAAPPTESGDIETTINPYAR